MNEELTRKPKNQTEAVLCHLIEYGHLTSLDAIKEYGITRLASIIHNLRKEFTITTEPQTHKNRFGNSVVIAVYKLNQ